MAQPVSRLYPAPGNLFPFDSPKQQMQGVHFPDGETLKSAMCRMFNEIDGEVLISVFLAWVKQLK
jgi:hypothetical protein